MKDLGTREETLVAQIVEFFNDRLSKDGAKTTDPRPHPLRPLHRSQSKRGLCHLFFGGGGGVVHEAYAKMGGVGAACSRPFPHGAGGSLFASVSVSRGSQLDCTNISTMSPLPPLVKPTCPDTSCSFL